MAINIAADVDDIQHPANQYDLSNGGTVSIGTIIMRIYLTDDTARQQIIYHVGGGGSLGEWVLDWRGDLAGDVIGFVYQRATTYGGQSANATSFASYGLNKWLFLAAVWNSSGVSTDQKLYMGDAVSPPTEPSPYATQGAGAGTPNAGSGILHVGNGTINTREMHGDVFHASIYNRVLSPMEIKVQWLRNMKVSGNIHFSFYGLQKDNQPEESIFRNTGTLAGAPTFTSRNPATRTTKAPSNWVKALPQIGGTNTPGKSRMMVAAA